MSEVRSTRGVRASRLRAAGVCQRLVDLEIVERNPFMAVTARHRVSINLGDRPFLRWSFTPRTIGVPSAGRQLRSTHSPLGPSVAWMPR